VSHKAGKIKRTLACVYSPFAPVGSVEFQITEKGLEGIAASAKEEQVEKGDAEMGEEVEESMRWEGFDDADFLAVLDVEATQMACGDK